jgi:hypothetical protein
MIDALKTTIKNRSNIILAVALFVISIIMGAAIVEQGFNLILAVVAFISVLLVLRSNLLAFVVLFAIAFFGNTLEDLHVLPAQITWLNEFMILLLLAKAIILKTLRKEKIHLRFLNIFLFFLLIMWIAYQFHPTTIFHSFLFFRLLIRFYLLFLAIINLDFDEKFMRTIINILIFLFIIQIPTAVVRVFFFGIGEESIGTYAVHGGGPSVVIPMMAIGFLFAYYFYYKPSFWYILLAAGFVAFGIIGGKRGLFLYIPVLLIFLGMFMIERVKKALGFLIIAAAITVLTGYISIRLMPTLNPQQKVGGEVDLTFVKNYLMRYTMARYEGYSGGRVITTIQIYEVLRNEGKPAIFFGLGPGSYIETRFEELKTTLVETKALPIEYGVPGSSWLALQVGYVGAFVYHLIFIFILVYAARIFRSEKEPYWKSFALGVVGYSFVMLIIGLTYWPVFIDDLLPMVYFILAAFLVRMKMMKEQPKEIDESP